MRVGVDTGGTFTDVVRDDGRISKVLSSALDPGSAVATALAQDGPVAVLAHGTTVATNALLERRGATVALVTDPGFTDVIEIGRQDRPSLYDPFADRPEPLVPRRLRIPVGEPIPQDATAVAVCLLHADLDPGPEREVAAALASVGDVTCSHEVSPEFREYERTVTTVINAYLRPSCRPYLAGLTRFAEEVLVMTSAGGLVPLAEAVDRPVALLLSGPAAGARAGAAVAAAAGFADAVTFDMGGTSTDVCLIRNGAPAPAAQRTVAGFPVRLPAVDVHTIGAGGGSIVGLDAGGALTVGPRSAGATPGPVCYGLGGTEPTVTDADLVAGRIDPQSALPGLGRLDTDAARLALEGAGADAQGVIDVVDAAMVEAVRVVTVRQGVDPRTLALVAFGGAGPLHACAVAEQLGMSAVVVPPRAGVLSAVGLLASPRQRDLVRSWPTPRDHDGLADALDRLGREAGPGEISTAVDCRYAGQSHEITVPTVADFEHEHRRRNGFARAGAPVEVVALRASACQASPFDPAELPEPSGRGDAVGPVALAEPDCTVWVPDGWTARLGGGGAWILRPSRS